MAPADRLRFEGANGRWRLERRRIVVSVLYLLYLLFLVLVSVRFVQWWRFERATRSVLPESRVWSYYYPELLRSGALAAGDLEAGPRVLLLGGSVLKHLSGPLEAELEKRIGRVQLVDLAVESHTSRDSFHKVGRLDLTNFDVAVFLHAINEVRFNYWPAGEFADDYSHVGWYRKIERDTREGFQASSWAFDMVRDFYELGPPTEDRWPWGAELKTALPFRSNLESIAVRASAAGLPLVVATMAIYLPESYTQDRFLAGELDYGDGPTRLPAEFWGKPEHVVIGVATHNEIAREIAAHHDGVVLVDLARDLPQQGELFEDPCHLTAAGLELAAERLAASLASSLNMDTGVNFGEGMPRGPD